MTPTDATTPDGVSTIRRIARWLFVNRRTGHITVAQWPNIALSAFIILSILQKVIRPTGSGDAVVGVLARSALLLWAIDELARGVNPFRRILGTVVMVATIASFIVAS